MRNICAAQQEKNVPPESINRAVIPALPQVYHETNSALKRD